MVLSARDDQVFERPIGITILAVLNGLGVLLAVFLLLPALTATRSVNSNAGSQIPLLLMEAVSGAVATIGLWKLQEWGRLVSIMRSGFVLLQVLIASASKTVTGSVLLQVLVSLGIIVYLVQSGVKQAFEQSKVEADGTASSAALGTALLSLLVALFIIGVVYSSTPSSPLSSTTITLTDPEIGPMAKQLTVEEEKEYNQDPSGFMSKWISVERQKRGKQ